MHFSMCHDNGPAAVNRKFALSRMASLPLPVVFAVLMACSGSSSSWSLQTPEDIVLGDKSGMDCTSSSDSSMETRDAPRLHHGSFRHVVHVTNTVIQNPALQHWQYPRRARGWPRCLLWTNLEAPPSDSEDDSITAVLEGANRHRPELNEPSSAYVPTVKQQRPWRIRYKCINQNPLVVAMSPI